ncbi:MAG: T9SS type A sorting domain-containing protein, partial [Bacteroidota bacterium]
LGASTVQLFNVEGKLLRTWQLETLAEQTLEFDTKPGLYYLRVTSRDLGQTLPIVFE